MSQSDAHFYINRELSWLQFNTRVLKEADNSKSPLLERLKFIAIYATNLDEFYMVRVAGLKRLYSARIIESGPDQLTPLQQLKEIRRYLHQEKEELERLYFSVVGELEKEGLKVYNFATLDKKTKIKVKEYFETHLYPMVTPIAVDATHPFPHLNNLSFAIAVKLQNDENPSEIKFGMVRIPRMLPRFIELDDNAYVPIETIVGEFVSDLFLGYSLLECTPFKVTRNADMEIEEEEADDFMELMQEGLKMRKKGEITRLEVGSNASEEMLGFLNAHLKVEEGDTYASKVPINLGALWEVIGNKNFPHLIFPPYNPRILAPMSVDANIFEILDENDVMMFHPYESFEPVVRLIQDASKDPDVYSIRMTLYRVGKNSPIVKALIEAAENGKQVSVLVELKARFDEENNLHWAKALESAGAHVIYGVPGLKVHAKIALIVKKVGKDIREYIHLSTGNYNPATAKIYTDISFMSSNYLITKDATKFFHNLSGFTHRSRLETLLVAPLQIKQKILALIESETKAGINGRIILKANSVVDVDIIKALYKASNAGVKIDLIVRGICCLRPKVPQVSENIRVISIIGKYLEHARIYYFKNASPQIYFASADLMPRNLERRIEIMTPAFNQDVANKLFGILKMQLEDDMQAYELQSDGNYVHVEQTKNINSQKVFEDYANTLYSESKCTEKTKTKRLVQRMLKES
ncbi:RNA degradosome polyphosphate kinase [Helicobacter monodelphidis]|uniref:RNA degradosome polyphosphate kinase n=1 Tax=Helicobacter sp. 15-1451 TaxID=2004995 RepID=UPI000DCC6DC4|nr:RNA degradosome polyphosphate kinase [Helicobacter sp. 15-1451]RAX58608.1 RNA degradosome polyphosphate kinase [Helicobacter sp. 15-1451]